MNAILERVESAISPWFRPETVLECCSLRLAQRLNDAKAVGHYVRLVNAHGLATVVSAYHSAQAGQGAPSAETFHAALGNGAPL